MTLYEARKLMNVIDLTHVIEENMPVYPGTQPPKIQNACTIEAHGFREKSLSFYSHTGTHMDAPAHILKEGETLDQINVDRFIGKLLVVDVLDYGLKIPKQVFERVSDALKEVDFVLLRTGWDRYWGTEAYFGEFPTITLESAAYLTEFNLKGIGVDAISVDPIASKDLGVHQILLSKGMVLIENMTGLDKLDYGDMLHVMPLKISDADGGPVRAVAIRGV